MYKYVMNSRVVVFSVVFNIQHLFRGKTLFCIEYKKRLYIFFLLLGDISFVYRPTICHKREFLRALYACFFALFELEYLIKMGFWGDYSPLENTAKLLVFMCLTYRYINLLHIIWRKMHFFYFWDVPHWQCRKY